MEIADRIGQYLWQFESRDDRWFAEQLRPRQWPPGVVGQPPHFQVARQCVRLLHSLAKAHDRGRMTDEQAARYKEILHRFRELWPLADGVPVPARLMAHIDGARGTFYEPAEVKPPLTERSPE